MVLSTRVIQKAILSGNFRRIVPEWKSIYAELDQKISDRKKRGQCGTCGLLTNSYETIKKDLISKPDLANRVREYFNVAKLDIAIKDSKTGKVEIKTVSKQG